MKLHRNIKKSSRIGDPSSKYGYGRDLDKDTEEKAFIQSELNKSIFNKLDCVMNTQIRYK